MLDNLARRSRPPACRTLVETVARSVVVGMLVPSSPKHNGLRNGKKIMLWPGDTWKTTGETLPYRSAPTRESDIGVERGYNQEQIDWREYRDICDARSTNSGLEEADTVKQECDTRVQSKTERFKSTVFFELGRPRVRC